jgi:hypothetical protein
MNTAQVVATMMNRPEFKVRKNAVPDESTIKAGNRFAARYAKELGYEQTPATEDEIYLGPKSPAKVESVALTQEEFTKLKNLYREGRVDTF